MCICYCSYSFSTYAILYTYFVAITKCQLVGIEVQVLHSIWYCVYNSRTTIYISSCTCCSFIFTVSLVLALPTYLYCICTFFLLHASTYELSFVYSMTLSKHNVSLSGIVWMAVKLQLQKFHRYYCHYFVAITYEMTTRVGIEVS